MAILFHDGTHPLYKQYVNGKAWNDQTLLQLDTHDPHGYKAWLQTLNTTQQITALLRDDGLAQCLPYGKGMSSVRDYITADAQVASVIVVKGLHHFEDRWTKAHITIGLDGLLWHLYAQWHANDGPGYMRFTTTITEGPRSTATTHDGFSFVGSGGKKKKR